MTHLSNKFTKNTKKVVVGSCCLVRRQTLSVFKKLSHALFLLGYNNNKMFLAEVQKVPIV